MILFFPVYLLVLLKIFFNYDKILAFAALVIIIVSFKLMLEDFLVFNSFFLLVWLAFIFTMLCRNPFANRKAPDETGRSSSPDSENDRNVRLPVKAERRG